MNENKENNIPDENESSKHATGEETKAFHWEWSDEGNVTPDAESTRAESNKSDTDRNESAYGDKNESNDGDKNESADIDKNESNDGGETIESETNSEPESEKRPRQNRAFTLSCILSACSIILLLAFSLSLMLGIFPLKGKEVIFIGVSDLGQTAPNTDASPELIEEFLHSVVVVKGVITETNNTSTGTGVIINENGYIITNYHVIENVDTVTVQLYGEDMAVKADIVGYHEADDVAVLKIDRTGLRAAAFADSDTVRYGEKVYAIGNPEGVDFAWSVTQGIVSCPLRELLIYGEDGITLEHKLVVVQTDAAVNHGNSGGPLINVRGEVIGIVTLKHAESAGLGFALPADGVAIDVAAIIEEGHANNVTSGIFLPRPLLGITGVGVEAETYYKEIVTDGQSGIEKVTEEYAKKNPAKTFYAAVNGVYVSAISAGSDAAKALRIGDIITEVNGTPVTIIYDVMDIVNRHNGGDTLTVKYYRDGEYYTAKLILKTINEIN